MDVWNVLPILQNIDLMTLKDETWILYNECTTRCCFQTAKWAAQLIYALKDIKTIGPPMHSYPYDETYLHTTELFRSGEYKQAYHVSLNNPGPEIGFIGRLALYLNYQKQITDRILLFDVTLDVNSIEEIKLIPVNLYNYYTKHDSLLDAFDLLLYGSVLKTLNLNAEAVDVLLRSLELCPYLWNTWQELMCVVKDRGHLISLNLPNHWCKVLFLSEMLIKLHIPEEASTLIQETLNCCPSLASFAPLNSLLARAMSGLRDVESAISIYQRIFETYPYNLVDLAEYSCLLFTTEDKSKLRETAKTCYDLDKYSVSTCIAMANMCSLNGCHLDALKHLRRALIVEPGNANLWTLVGHECIEQHQPKPAIKAYLKAIEVDRRDFKAWFGLGQTYEALRQPQMAIYYFLKAHTFRPNDSRILVALGGIYESSDMGEEAGKCYWKAHCVGDAETVALLRLGKMYEHMGKEEQAAVTFRSYLDEIGRSGIYENIDLYHAYMYLARYHMKRKNWQQVIIAAKVCIEYPGTRSEAQGMLANFDQTTDDSFCF